MNGLVLLVGPSPAQPRAEPGPGRADQTSADQPTPAAKRATGDHRLTRTRKQRPLIGRLDTIAHDPPHRLQHRAQRRSAPPQLGRQQRNGGTVAEFGPQDRDLLEHLACRKILHPLPVPPAVWAGTVGRLTGRTEATGLTDQIGVGELPKLDRAEVVPESRCEYTTDCLWRASTGPIGRQNFTASCSHVSLPDQSCMLRNESHSLTRHGLTLSLSLKS